MSITKKAVSIILTFCLLLSGCSDHAENSQETSAPVGRFVETDITPTDVQGILASPLGVFPHADGTLDYFTMSGEAKTTSLLHYTSTDNGANWKAQPTQWYDTLFSQYGKQGANFVMGITMDGQKDIYLLILTQERRFRLFKIANQTPTEYFIPDWDAPEFYDNLMGFVPRVFTALSDNRIGFLFGGGSSGTVFVYDLVSGKEIHRADIGRGTVLLQDDQYLCVNFQEREQAFYLSAFDYKGIPKPDPIPLNEKNVEDALLCSGAEDSVFLISQSEVDHAVKNGSILEKVMDGKNYSFGSPSAELVAFQYEAASDSFYLLIENKDVNTKKLLRYTYDSTLQTSIEGTLTVFSMRDSNTLRQAISSFNVQYPTQKVELQIGLPEGTAVTQNDAIRILNAELLAGRGPDVLILDGLPIDSYVRKGVLADLSALAQSDQYFTNITGAYEHEGVIRAIPARYIVPVMAADPQLLNGITGLPQLANLAKATFEASKDAIPSLEEPRPLFQLNYYSDPIRLFYPIYEHAIINDDKTLNTTVLAELLESIKALCDTYPPNDLGSEAIPIDLQRQILSMSPMDFYGEQTQLAVANATGFSDFVVWADSKPTANGAVFVSPDLYMLPLCGPATGVFIPSVVAGVSASGKNQAAALQFVETLLSDDVQRPNYWEGFPVNKKAFAECNVESVEKGLVSYAVDVEQLVSNLTTPAVADELLLGVILEEARPYFTESETLDATVQNIVKRTRTYFSEQS